MCELPSEKPSESSTVSPKRLRTIRRRTDSEKSDYPVKAIEQWANLTCRYALEKAKRSSDVGMPVAELKDIATSVEEAIEVLQKLRDLAPTSERLCLLGSAHKRAALIYQGNKRKKAITMMATRYKEAMKISDEKDYYPILNELTGRIVSGWLKAGVGGPSDAEVERLTAKCESLARAEENAEPSFWSLVTIADCLLIRSLTGNTLSEKDKEVSKNTGKLPIALYRRDNSGRLSNRSIS